MSIGEIEPAALQALLGSEETYACIDVRERGEFALEQIEDVTPLPRGTLEYRVHSMIPGPNIPVVVCCDDGERSALAAVTLEAMGYTNVHVLQGGLAGWRRAGFPTIEGWGARGKLYGEQVLEHEHVPQMTAEELTARRRRGEPVLVVDPRTEEEYLRGHVPGAYSVPGGQLPVEIRSLADDADLPIVVSCAGRTRGILGAQCLREHGYRNAVALLNGAMGWLLAGYELETGAGNGRPAASTPTRATIDLAQRASQEEGIAYMPIPDLERLQAGDEPHYVVDVRLPDEYRAGHLPGALSLPSGQFALMHENMLAVRQLPLVIVADDPVRPVWAAVLAQRLGFSRVSVLEGGIQAWSDSGHTLEKGAPEAEVFGLAAARSQVNAITPRELEALTKPNSSTVVLDVRGSGDFAAGHIPDSRWLARGKLELRIGAVVPDADTPIVVVCDTGVRSALAASTLRSLGYRKARYLLGGLAAWREAGLQVIDGLEGADVTRVEAQNDAGSTQWTGALARTREDMEQYLSWEEALTRR